MMLNVFVTGGAGYIGSVFVPQLLHRGYKVTVLDNFMYHQNSFLDVCYHPGLKVIKGDIRDKRQLKTLIQTHDILVPLAAIVGAPACEKDLTLARDINQVQIENIAKWVTNDQMVLYPVTNSGYGIGQKGIYCEDYKEPIFVEKYEKTIQRFHKMLNNCYNI